MNTRSILPLLTAVVLALSGCANQTSSSSGRPQKPPKFSPVVLQEELMSFSDRFSSAVTDAYDQASASATSSHVQDYALTRKTEDLAASISNATDDNPIVGLLDTLVMTSLMRTSAEAAWFKQTFGDSAARIAAIYKQQETEIWQIAPQYVNGAQLIELRESIERWLSEHPDQRHVAMVRLADISRGKSGKISGQGTGSVFGLLFLDPLSSLDPAVREVERSRETAQRMFFYFQRMPALIAWQAELSARRSLNAPQFTSFLDSASRFADSTSKFAQASSDVAESINGFPATLTKERKDAMEQAAQQVEKQRDASVRQVAAAVTAEREATIQHLDSLLQSERAGLVRDTNATMKGLIDRIIWGQIIVVASVLACALVYRKLRPR
jgi:hypothetical protein